MNQRPTGFLQYKSAEGLSLVTVTGYDHDLKLWIEYQGDMDVAEVQTTHILAYLNYLRTDYVPRRITGNNDKKLSPKTVYNLYISVASFFTWASREFQIDNPVKGVPRPCVPEAPPVEPFKKEEIELLIKACDFCEEAVTDRRRKFIMQRSTSKRDKANLLTLLDTGLRAGELCALRVGDVDMKTGKICIRPGDAGKAKGGKGRVVYLVTSYSPNAGFSVGAAMGRNRLIYTLADYAIVVASDAETGGTWAGATEALKNNWIPVFVLEHERMPEGNKLLLQKGALPFPQPFKEAPVKLPAWLKEKTTNLPAPPSQVCFSQIQDDLQFYTPAYSTLRCINLGLLCRWHVTEKYTASGIF